MLKTSRSLDIIIHDLFRSKLFLFGLFLKIALIVVFIPEIQSEWFLPFVINFIENPSILPWNDFVDSGGNPLAFPYGPIMLITHLPTTYIGHLIDTIIGTEYFAGLGFRLSLLLCDIAIIIVLVKQLSESKVWLILFYWLSPLLIFINYWHGQTDIVPTMFLMASLLMLRSDNPINGGLLMGVAIAAKHTVLISVPFVLMYLWFKRGITKSLVTFFITLTSTIILLEGPFIFTDGFIEMVLQNREIVNLFWLSIPMGENFEIYIIPIAYIGLCYYVWTLKRMNYELLLAILGVAFGILIVTSPAPPGWYLWLLPIVALHISKGRLGSTILGIVFYFSFTIFHFLNSQGAENIFDVSLQIGINDILFDNRIMSLLNTATISLVCIILFQMLRDGVFDNDFYVLGKSPFVIGIAGDSGAGKSTLAKSLVDLFGVKHVLEVEGDNYHKFDRYSPMWKTMTHLDPRANDQFKLLEDVRHLIRFGRTKTRNYDHKTGFFTEFQNINSKDFIIVNGLHSLYSDQLSKLYDIKIFISMDENLRRDLKIYRDVEIRGKDLKKTISEIKRRGSDAELYIAPQSQKADISFQISRDNNDVSVTSIDDNRNVLSIGVKDGAYYQELLSILTGLLGLQVDVSPIKKDGSVVFKVQGDVSEDDLFLAIEKVAPHFLELIDTKKGFYSGMSGIMQLVIIMQADEALKNRRTT